MINDHQMTIIWHADELRISHKDGLEITKIIKWLGKIYGDIKGKRGKQHHYLGMDLNCEDDKKVKASMIPYIEEIIKNFPEEIGSSTTMAPAAEHLFEIRKKGDAKFIPEEQAMQFHHNVAKLLFKSTRA